MKMITIKFVLKFGSWISIFIVLRSLHQGECYCNTCECCAGTCISNICNYYSQCVYNVCDDRGCKPGFWGSYCTFDCSKGCYSGTCDQHTGYCSTCKDGYYGQSCEWPCNENCLGPCSQSDGSCSSCKDERWGDYCNQWCIANCKSCNSRETCDKCEEGYWGDICLACRTNCADNCEQRSGVCYNGCKNGFWGEFCNQTCSDRCSNGCLSTTGHCKQCKSHNMYGHLCNQECSTTCLFNECEQNSSDCIKGCIKDFFGSKCEHMCSLNCLPSTKNESVCSYVDGKCLYGCSEGFIGDLCEERKRHHEEAASKSPVVYVVVGGSIGIVVLVIILVVLIFLMLKQRTLKKREARIQEEEDVASHVTPMVSVSNDAVYVNSVAEQHAPVVVVTVSNAAYQQPRSIPARELGPDDSLEIDDDDEVARAMAIRFEEKGGVYYYNDDKINNEKVVVADIAQYVAGRTMFQYEEEFEKLPYGLIKPYSASQLRDNLIMNRYKGIYPYNDSRVKIIGGITDFINASYIDGYKMRNEFIATLGPMKKQLGDYGAFWRMVWQQNVETVVMLTQLKEGKIDKCEQYWPNANTTTVYGGVTVTCTREDVNAEFTQRTFTVEMDKEKRVLHHMHCTSWPDRGVPHDVITLVDFRHRVISLPKQMNGPVVVHCSAGIGRTGTYIALDILTKEGLDSGRIDVPGCVLNMRQNRPNMIQTLGQYRYLHHALVHTLTLPWEPVKVNNFSRYMQQKGAFLHIHLELIQQCTDPLTEEEKQAVAVNKGRTDKNRNNADIPGDDRRPILHIGQPVGSVGYTNAKYINSLKTTDRLLLAQTPLPATVDDFLMLALQEKCSCIVDLDPEHTMSKDVGEYFPADNQMLRTELVEVTSTRDVATPPYYTKRSLLVKMRQSTSNTSPRVITHLQFTGWDCESIVPSSTSAFCKFVQAVDELSKASPDGGPIFIHCMNAAERCGLFSAVYLLLEQVTCEGQVSVINTVRKVRAVRGRAIPCQKQFEFCHQCILDIIAVKDTIYANS